MPKGRGRETKLTPAIEQAMAHAIAAGIPMETAALLAGISPGCAKGWIQRGLGEHPTRRNAPVYRSFAEAVLRARAEDEARRVARIEEAGRGGAVIYRKTLTAKNGTQTTEERFAPPDWQADAWHLSRSRPQEWGEKARLDLRVLIQDMAAKVAAEHGLRMEDVLAEAQAMLTETDHAPALLGPPTGES